LKKTGAVLTGFVVEPACNDPAKPSPYEWKARGYYFAHLFEAKSKAMKSQTTHPGCSTVCLEV